MAVADPTVDVDVPAMVQAVAPFANEAGPMTALDVSVRLEDIRRHRAQLRILMKNPGIEQRTEAWYAARKRMITASDLAQALGHGKFGTQRDLVIKKTGYEPEAPFPDIPPLRWGVKYEPVAIELYKKRTGLEVHEFGLLPHPTVSHFGASPDGINDMGVMVEIKCPFRRQITGEVPEQYGYQIQGQLDVCGLDDCDYTECAFREYRDRESFLESAEGAPGPGLASDGKDVGVLVEYVDAAGERRYLYGPLGMTQAETAAWADGTVVALNALLGERRDLQPRITFWVLEKFSCVRVVRDPALIEAALEGLAIVWDRIKAYKDDRGLYDQEMTATAPVKRARVATTKPKAMPAFSFRRVQDDDDMAAVPPVERCREMTAEPKPTAPFLFRKVPDDD